MRALLDGDALGDKSLLVVFLIFMSSSLLQENTQLVLPQVAFV